MSHILFISRHYCPEKAAAAVCVSETAKRLVRSGHQMTVLTTFPNYPTGIVPPEYRGHIIQSEMLDGVRVIRTWCYLFPNKGFFRRVLAQLSFGCLAPWLGWKELGRPDMIIVGSPPLFNVIAGRILAWLKHCPLIFMVADPWPEAAIQSGVLRNRILIRLAKWLEWSTYQQASLIWVVAEWIRDNLIQRGLSSERLFLLTNGVDTAKFRPLPRAQARAELGWDDSFTLIFAGNHGLLYSMKSVLDAAEQMRDYADIRMVFVGDGIQKAEMKAEASRRNLKNITFLDPVPHERIPLLLAAADIGLIPLRTLPFLEGAVPVKMLELMACARPCILAGGSETGSHIAQRAGAAIYVEPENAAALVSAILYLRNHPDVAEALGQRGRALVEARFDYDQLTEALEARLAMLLGKKEDIRNTRKRGRVNRAI